MPLLHVAIHTANSVTGQPGEGFDPESILSGMGDASSLLEATQNSGLLDVLGDQAPAYEALLEAMPAALDQAMLAAMQDALKRKLRVQLVWQEAASYELRMWEASSDSLDENGHLPGVLTLFLRSPEPEELTQA